jgi:hypothetical protein
MSEKNDKPTTISLVPSTLAFAVLTVITLAGAFLAMVYNANGNTF